LVETLSILNTSLDPNARADDIEPHDLDPESRSGSVTLLDKFISFRTHPDRYKHWKLTIDGRIATLALDVDEDAPIAPGYELKLNSYDLGVDIELRDAILRLRFEHPEVGAVVITSAKDKVFCSGANIQMLASSNHSFKVNFCKFTNETRNQIEEASHYSGQRYICAVGGTAAGGGYELALATDYIILVDDASAAVSLPEVPLLGVLPGTGGLTRLVDKRKVRRDLADVVATKIEGTRGQKALEWGLVDETAPKSTFAAVVHQTAARLADSSPRPMDAKGISLPDPEPEIHEDSIIYPYVRAEIDRTLRTATITISAPVESGPRDLEAIAHLGPAWWPLAMVSQLDDLILWLRFNEATIGTFLLKTRGEPEVLEVIERTIWANQNNWLVNEVISWIRSTLRRLETSSRSLIALIDEGSCFVGILAEAAFACDRIYMLTGLPDDDSTDHPASNTLKLPTIQLTPANFGPLPMDNGLTRLESRFLKNPDHVHELTNYMFKAIDATLADKLGLVTFALDEIDWDDEIRLVVEERASFSPDALIAMEANLRFCGPETVATKVFGRLSAWQNWVFQRPNATGHQGALRSYGTGLRPAFDQVRT